MSDPIRRPREQGKPVQEQFTAPIKGKRLRRKHMAVIHDVMPAFGLSQPASTADAVKLLHDHGSDAWVMAGGLDSFDWLKDRIKRPKVLVDLSQIRELVGVKEADGGIEIGAMTTLTDVVRHPVVKDKFKILTQAAESAASPQIRNQGTIGGNVSQDARCWDYRAGFPFYRACVTSRWS